MKRACMLLVCLLCACGSEKKVQSARERATALGGDIKGSGGKRCDASLPSREVSEYDTSGDNRPDIRKVYMALGTGAETRMVMICRETDLNSDGQKDVIRYYDDEGRSLREESDRNFDGKMDLALVFQDGQVVRKELDEDHDGIVDTKIFLEGGEPLRAERDLEGRSTLVDFRPNRWEYYEEGRIVRMGTDLDADGRVDRWDRDATFESKEEQAAEVDAASQAAEDSAADAEAEMDDEG
ncbi:MAG: hypothetical protein PVI30_02960 [Myxococcales bacterium]|jgi:hypothetical protein